MPEGPEVRREADAISRVLKGKRITEVYFGPAQLKCFKRTVIDQTVVKVTARGKALLIFFENGQILYSHNQLYGRWFVAPEGKVPNTRRSLRVVLTADSYSARLYSATDIAMLNLDTLSEHPYLRKLGPDVLSDSLSWREVAERLRSRSFCGRRMSGLYLDQSFLAGLGNYLRSEILFSAGVNPIVKPQELDSAKINELARRTLMLSVRAYKSGGVTNHPDTVRALRKAGYPKSKHRFAVFGRDKSDCYRCGEEVRRITANGRRLYLCPSCQR
tara:strand:+ start:159 stop:977 length:819 start_codon:yes stop_codon:yes gene_type:complete